MVTTRLLTTTTTSKIGKKEKLPTFATTNSNICGLNEIKKNNCRT